MTGAVCSGRASWGMYEAPPWVMVPVAGCSVETPPAPSHAYFGATVPGWGTPNSVLLKRTSGSKPAVLQASRTARPQELSGGSAAHVSVARSASATGMGWVPVAKVC